MIKISMTCVQRVWSQNKNATGITTTTKNEVFNGI